MNAYVIKDSTVVNIADAIREKLSISDTMTPLEMPNMIRQINGGGGGQVTYATLGLLNYPSNYKNFIFTNNTSVLPSNYLNQMYMYNCMTMDGNDLVFRIVDDTNFNCYIYTNSELKNIKFIGDFIKSNDAKIEFISPELLLNLTRLEMLNCPNYRGALVIPSNYNRTNFLTHPYMWQSALSKIYGPITAQHATDIIFNDFLYQDSYDPISNTGSYYLYPYQFYSMFDGIKDVYHGNVVLSNNLRNFGGSGYSDALPHATGSAKFLNVPMNCAYAYNNCVGITDVILSPYCIGWNYGYAFNNCVNLENVNFNNTENYIVNMYCMFNGCKKLTEAIIGASVENVYYAYAYCSNLKKVSVYTKKQNITSDYPQYAFSSSTENIEEIYFNSPFPSNWSYVPYFQSYSSSANYNSENHLTNLRYVYLGTDSIYLNWLLANYSGYNHNIASVTNELLIEGPCQPVQNACGVFKKALHTPVNLTITTQAFNGCNNAYSFFQDCTGGIYNLIPNVDGNCMQYAYAGCTSLNNIEGILTHAADLSYCFNGCDPDQGNLFFNWFSDTRFGSSTVPWAPIEPNMNNCFGVRTNTNNHFNLLFMNGGYLGNTFRLNYNIIGKASSECVQGEDIPDAFFENFNVTGVNGKFYPELNLSVYDVEYDYGSITSITYLLENNQSITDVLLETEVFDSAHYNINNIINMHCTYKNSSVVNAWIGENTQDISSICENCLSLRSINCTNFDNVTNVVNAFKNCYNLSLPNGPICFNNVTNISGLYQNCQYLNGDVVFSNITEDLSYAFAGTNVTLNENKISFKNVTNLAYTFYNCSKIEKGIIPPNVNVTGTYANCNSIIYFDYRKPILSYANNVFSNCIQLIKMPNTIKSFQYCDSAFSYCQNLNNISNNLESILYSPNIFEYTGIQILPESLIEINHSDNAFAYSKLNALPSNLQYITYSNNAFRGCVIKELSNNLISISGSDSLFAEQNIVEIPEGLNNFIYCNNSFASCRNLETFKTDKITLSNCYNTFSNCPNLTAPSCIEIYGYVANIFESTPFTGADVKITGNIQACDNTWDISYSIKQDFNYAFMNTRLNNILFDFNVQVVAYNYKISDHGRYTNGFYDTFNRKQDNFNTEPFTRLNIVVTNRKVYNLITNNGGSNHIGIWGWGSGGGEKSFVVESDFTPVQFSYANGTIENYIPVRGIYASDGNIAIYCLE